MSLARVVVDLGPRSYPVVVGHGAIGELSTLIPPRVERVAVVTDPSIPFRVTVDRPTFEIQVSGGEKAKNLDTIRNITSSFARHGLTRRDLVLGVGADSSPTSPVSPRRSGIAGPRFCTCRRPFSGWSTPPSVARRR